MTEHTGLIVVLDVGAGAVERLQAATSVATLASVMLSLGVGGDGAVRDAAEVVKTAQRLGIAVLIVGDATSARTLRADGIHLPVTERPLDAYHAAREQLGARAMIGVDAGRSRHDAMTLGEAGADYVGFGIPGFVKERDQAVDRRLELVGWWAEIFEVPCVAMDVATPEEACDLSRAGADFVAFQLVAGTTIDEVRTRTQAFASAVAEAAVQRGIA